MMAMIENGMISEKANTFNSLNSSGSNDYKSNHMQQSQHSLFTSIDNEMNSYTNNKFIGYGNSPMVPTKDQNNNYFHFEQTDPNSNCDLLDYSYFTRFSNLMEMNTHSGKLFYKFCYENFLMNTGVFCEMIVIHFMHIRPL